MKPIEEFTICDWLSGTPFEGVPRPPDRYSPGHISWGANPTRGRAIQAARRRKQWATNAEHFKREVFPLIRQHLTKPQLFDVAVGIGLADALKDSGYRLWRLGDKQSWLPFGDEREATAEAIGARLVDPEEALKQPRFL